MITLHPPSLPTPPGPHTNSRHTGSASQVPAPYNFLPNLHFLPSTEVRNKLFSDGFCITKYVTNSAQRCCFSVISTPVARDNAHSYLDLSAGIFFLPWSVAAMGRWRSVQHLRIPSVQRAQTGLSGKCYRTSANLQGFSWVQHLFQSFFLKSPVRKGSPLSP